MTTSSIKPVLSVLAFLAFFCPEPIMAQQGNASTQTAAPPAGPDIYGFAARKLLSKNRNEFTYSRFQKYTFVPYSRELQQGKSAWGTFFEEKQAPRHPDGKPLSLASNGAEVGDIVLMEHPGMKPLVLVYAGQHRFPDQGQEVSFFIYPYSGHAGLELNTMPPRWNRRLLKKLLSVADDTSVGLQDAKFLTAEYKPGVTIDWLQSPKIINSLYVPTKWTKPESTYCILRSKGLFALKKPLRYHKQQRYDSCVFAAIVNAENYLRKEQWTVEEMVEQENQLLRQYIDEPSPGSTAEKVAKTAKRLREIAKKEAAPDSPEATLPDSEIVPDFWIRPAYSSFLTSQQGFKLKPLPIDPNETEFRYILELYLSRDEPLIASYQTHNTKAEIGELEQGSFGSLANYRRKHLPQDGDDNGGHAVVITGLRWDGAHHEWLIYYVCSKGNKKTHEQSDDGYWVTSLKEFYARLREWHSKSIDPDDPGNKAKRTPISQLLLPER